MRIERKRKQSRIEYTTLLTGKPIGEATLFFQDKSPRDIWCNELGMPYAGFCPILPEGLNPTEKYKTAMVNHFIPNGKHILLRERGHATQLLDKMTSDAISSNAKIIAITNVTTPELSSFLTRHSFTHLPRSQNYIKNISTN